ncbi:hypothetical protein D3C76_1312550 [compost metagenome]
MVVALFNIQRDARQIGFLVEGDIGHTPYHYPANAHRRTAFQAADIIEGGIDAICGLGADRRNIRHFEA